MIVQEFNLNMIPDSEPIVVHVNQYDTEQGRFVIHLYNGDTPYTPTNASVLIEGRKPDGKVFAYGAANGVSISGNTVTAPCLIQMTAMEGRTRVNLIVKENGASTGTFVFWLDVQETPINQHVPASDTEIPALVALAEEQAERSEAWAVGTKNGHPVPDTDPTYENNSKYWAEQAASSVTGVASFNGRGGSVLPMVGDYNSDMIPHTMSSSIQPIGGIQPGETVMSKRIINALTSEVEKKSDKTDLTSIIAIGSTNATGSTIKKGTYFYLNGVFVKALADIANGATFTIGTNVSQARVGDELTATDYISNVTWSKTVTSGYVKKVGNIVDVRMLFENLTLSNGGTLCTLPEAVRPTQHVNGPVYDYATGYQISGGAISILSTGVVGYYGSTALSNRRITFNVCFIN